MSGQPEHRLPVDFLHKPWVATDVPLSGRLILRTFRPKNSPSEPVLRALIETRAHGRRRLHPVSFPPDFPNSKLLTASRSRRIVTVIGDIRIEDSITASGARKRTESYIANTLLIGDL